MTRRTITSRGIRSRYQYHYPVCDDLTSLKVNLFVFPTSLLLIARIAQSIVEGVFAMPQTVYLTKATFLAYILPPFACQYLMGVLVQLEGTRTYRIALLPVAVCLAWRATFVDMSGGDPTKAPTDTTLINQMCIVATRSIVWALACVRYQRHTPLRKPDSDNVYTACWNAWDLLLNVRGIGWNWSQGLVVPKPTFKTNSRVGFALFSAVAFIFHAVALDACIQAIRVLSPEIVDSPGGGTLFDHTLPPFLELLRAVLVTFLTGAAVYFLLQHTYHLLGIVCVILFQQHPSHWPPLFDIPPLSTSLNELWARRWHLMMRDTVLNLGHHPLNRLFGRFAGLLGAFLVSGVFHSFDLEQHRSGYVAVCLLFWVMNGVGVALERLWKKTTGREVQGVWGRVWGAGWLFLWGIPMADVYARVGRLAALRVVGGFEPSLAIIALVRRLARLWLG